MSQRWRAARRWSRRKYASLARRRRKRSGERRRSGVRKIAVVGARRLTDSSAPSHPAGWAHILGSSVRKMRLRRLTAISHALRHRPTLLRTLHRPSLPFTCSSSYRVSLTITFRRLPTAMRLAVSRKYFPALRKPFCKGCKARLQCQGAGWNSLNDRYGRSA